jgi:hypothetical protein
MMPVHEQNGLVGNLLVRMSKVAKITFWKFVAGGGLPTRGASPNTKFQSLEDRPGGNVTISQENETLFGLKI